MQIAKNAKLKTKKNTNIEGRKRSQINILLTFIAEHL